MNANRYRIVFNKTRGQMMAVAETATAQGKEAAQGERSSNDGQGAFFARIGLIRFAVLSLLGLALISPLTLDLARAQGTISADPNAPATQRPTILPAGNGVPVVNIQTPSAAGVSRNTYSQFDVNNNGAILNNSRTDVQTGQAGWIQGNPWLATGSARVILNEVNSANPSALRGYVEVAGARAQVIIANPAGITCDGCGFINANQVTLTSGTPIFNGSGHLESYRVTGGVISFLGAGMDARGADYTSIIARAVSVNAGLWANNLSVIAGASTVDASAALPGASNTALISDANTASLALTRPQFGIDVGELGGMYAGKIILVGTEAGVGVRNAGAIGAGAGEVTVTSEGRIQNSGTLYAQNLSVSASGTLQNSGVMAAAQNASLLAKGTGTEAGQIINTASGTMGAGLASDFTLNGSGQLSVSATDNISASGQLIGGQSAHLQASRISLVESSISATDLSIDAREVALDRSELTIGGTMALHSHSELSTQGASIFAQHLNITAQSLNNEGGELVQTGAGALNLFFAGNLNNKEGRIATNGDLSVEAQNLSNVQGNIESGGDLALTITAGALNNAGGSISSQARLSATANSLNNQNGEILHYGTGSFALNIAAALENNAGYIASNSAQALINARSVNNTDGVLNMAGALTLQSGALDNTRGDISAVGDTPDQCKWDKQPRWQRLYGCSTNV